MKAFYLERDGQYLGATGWGGSMSNALRFDTEATAKAGIADFARAYASLMRGNVRVVGRDVEPPLNFGASVHVDYDPFNVRAP